MPPQIQALLQDRRILIAAGAVLVGLILLLIWHPWSANESSDPNKQPLAEAQRKLATVDSIGKAIEVQALLAREGIRVDRQEGDGGKAVILFGDKATLEDRDRALIAMVQSGLMDRNIGLESFDKGDLTASREEKRIKLIRAQQGEIARLIRKIPPIEDASVSLSIPEQTIFKSEQKPMSASVQVTVPNGERLTRDKVRSIINLMVGSIQGLDAQHVALSDTNGNTYNSVLDVGSELNNKLEEQDQYMKQKVSAQLDRLVGPGHYVVTVSTLLREAPKETMVQEFDPRQSAVSTKQSFSERLNSAGKASGAGGPVSSFVPNGVTASGGGSNRGYTRSGTEVSYSNSKTQWVETSLPGMIEDISIAVTIDRTFFPSLDPDTLQKLLANAASPKVDPYNVTIARADFQQPTVFNKSDAPALEKNNDWIWWAAGSAVACILVVLVLMMAGRGGNHNAMDKLQLERTQQELQQLRDFTAQQQTQIQAAQQQTQLLMEQQKQLSLQAPLESPMGPPVNQLATQTSQLKQTLSELKEVVAEENLDEEDLDLQIKTWIESS